MKKKQKTQNELGWLLVEKPKHVILYEPEKKKLTKFLRHFPVWGPLLILSPAIYKDPSFLWIYLIVALPIGLIFSSREFSPTFFANGRKCGFSATSLSGQFRPDECIILTHEGKENEIYVAETKKGLMKLVWEADTPENYEKIMSALGRFIKREGTLRSEPNGAINSEAAASPR